MGTSWCLEMHKTRDGVFTSQYLNSQWHCRNRWVAEKLKIQEHLSMCTWKACHLSARCQWRGPRPLSPHEPVYEERRDAEVVGLSVWMNEWMNGVFMGHWLFTTLLTHRKLCQAHVGASYRNLPELSPLLLPECYTEKKKLSHFFPLALRAFPHRMMY